MQPRPPRLYHPDLPTRSRCDRDPTFNQRSSVLLFVQDIPPRSLGVAVDTLTFLPCSTHCAEMCRFKRLSCWVARCGVPPGGLISVVKIKSVLVHMFAQGFGGINNSRTLNIGPVVSPGAPKFERSPQVYAAMVEVVFAFVSAFSP